jgi:hypothetical protein
MLTHNDLGNIRDENEAENTWRKYSRHVTQSRDSAYP